MKNYVPNTYSQKKKLDQQIVISETPHKRVVHNVWWYVRWEVSETSFAVDWFSWLSKTTSQPCPRSPIIYANWWSSCASELLRFDEDQRHVFCTRSLSSLIWSAWAKMYFVQTNDSLFFITCLDLTIVLFIWFLSPWREWIDFFSTNKLYY
jgi:hypothetical protein